MNKFSYRFAADPNSDQHTSPSVNQEQVELAMHKVIKLREFIGTFDESVRLSHSCILKNGKTTTREGSSGLVYPEDEGFQTTSNLYSTSPPAS